MLGKGHAMRVKLAFAMMVAVLQCGAALARELPQELRSLIEGFQAHRRVAVGYLRTQNGDLGAAEIESLQRRWATDRAKLPSMAAADGTLAAALARVEALVKESLKAADNGDTERAHSLLEGAAEPLAAWRKSNGFRLFSDCIVELSATYERLDVYRVNRPNLNDSSTAERVIKASNDTVAALDRCNHEAPNALSREAEFRRLFDGMRASLAQMRGAVQARDGALLHRLLIEQRSFERLLLFRFG